MAAPATIAPVALIAEPELAVALPPLECVPPGVRDALARYRSGTRDGLARAALIEAVDQLAPRWEGAAAARVAAFNGGLVRHVLALDELHSRLTADLAALEWLRGFPHRTIWRPQPLECEVAGRPAQFPEVLLALLEPVTVSTRVRRLARDAECDSLTA